MKSGDHIIETELPRLFEEFSAESGTRRLMVICRSRSRRRRDEFLPPETECSWYFNIKSLDDIGSPERADVGIVLNQIEHMRRTDAMHLLSRLRDQYCRKVLLLMASNTFTEQELLALGYIRQERPSTDGQFYLFDPDIFFERREWNTPANWAHPQNFNKSRW